MTMHKLKLLALGGWCALLLSATDNPTPAPAPTPAPTNPAPANPTPAPANPAPTPANPAPTPANPAPANPAHELPADVKAALAELDQIKRAAAEAERAKLSEVERLKVEKAELAAKAEKAEAAVKAARIDNAILTEAAKKGLRNPALYASLLDRSKMTVGEDGAVKGVAEALDALKVQAPELFGAPVNPIKTGPDTPDGGKAGGKPETPPDGLTAQAKAIAQAGNTQRRKV